MKRCEHIGTVLISFAVLFLLWQFGVTVSGVNHALFPTPIEVFRALFEEAKSGVLTVSILASLRRFAIAYLLSSFAAVTLGFLLGWFTRAFAFANPIIQLLRPISPTAWMPFAVLWFGIGDAPAIAIIFLAAFFPVLLSTVRAVRSVNPIYFKVAENFELGRFDLFRKIILPAAFPQIANGIRLALGTAWIFLVAGEMVGAQSGLGYLIIDARNNIRADRLMGAMLLIGLIGLMLDSLMSGGEKFVLSRFGGGADVH